MKLNADTVIVGSGVAGLFSALNLPREQDIILITKSDLESSDSFLAQGGICVLRDESDYDSYFEDTMKAGHYENRKESVDIMIRNSRDIINDLVKYGVEFEKKDGEFAYTREGAHSRPRILFHEDVTGKEITSKLLAQVKELKNVKMYEYTEMTDVIIEDDKCVGIKAKNEKGTYEIYAENTILASGGIGGTYQHSTNFPHLTGDAIEIAKKHGIRLEHLDYVQIHPTTLYSKKPGRRFLISESVRGEGAVLYNKNKERFVDELLPRDVVTKAIREEMEKVQSRLDAIIAFTGQTAAVQTLSNSKDRLSGTLQAVKSKLDFLQKHEPDEENRSCRQLTGFREELDQLKAEVLRLKEFENQQVEFQRIQKEFYDEVVYSDKGPGAEEYKKYYESMDPATAEYIYKQVVTQLQESKEVQDYAAAYSSMKPKQAAAIFARSSAVETAPPAAASTASAPPALTKLRLESSGVFIVIPAPLSQTSRTLVRVTSSSPLSCQLLSIKVWRTVEI